MPGWYAGEHWKHMTLLIFSLLVLSIILVNLLIAMLNYSYSLVFESADVAWKFAKAKSFAKFERCVFPNMLNLSRILRVLSKCYKLFVKQTP